MIRHVLRRSAPDHAARAEKRGRSGAWRTTRAPGANGGGGGVFLANGIRSGSGTVSVAGCTGNVAGSTGTIAEASI